MLRITKEQQELLRKYRSLVEEMYCYKKDQLSDQIKSLFEELTKNIETNDVFDFVKTFSASGASALDDILLKQFILKRRTDIKINDLWNKIFQNTASIRKKNENTHHLLTELDASNVKTALIILKILLGQDQVEQTIFKVCHREKINNNALYKLACEYTYLSEGHYFFPNCDFLYEILKILFADFPVLPFEIQDVKDLLLIRFIHFYNSAPEGMDDDIFRNKLIKKIKKLNDAQWKLKLGKTQKEVLDFVKKQYEYNSGYNHWHFEFGDKDEEGIKKILKIIKFKSEHEDKIEQFLRENPLTPFGKIRYMLEYYEGRSDDDVRTDKDIVIFIKTHIDEFLYDEFLDRLIHCEISDSMTAWELLIVILLKGSERVNHDILEKYEKGAMFPSSLHYIAYVYPHLKSSGVKVDMDFVNKISRIARVAINKTKKQVKF